MFLKNKARPLEAIVLIENVFLSLILESKEPEQITSHKESTKKIDMFATMQ
jgi:hypothetical protein